MLTTVPFAGFYESIHSSEIDREFESMVSDSSGCSPISERISENLYSHFSTPLIKYAQEYTEDFATYFSEEVGIKLSLKFDDINTPREYNFRTDRIFASVPRATVWKLFAACDKTMLDKVIKDRFTTCSGFISYYTPDRTTWGRVDTWDHNQVACILMALMLEHFDENWEYNIIENWSGSGFLSDCVYGGLDKEGQRLVKIADYLREREERKYRTQRIA